MDKLVNWQDYKNYFIDIPLPESEPTWFSRKVYQAQLNLYDYMIEKWRYPDTLLQLAVYTEESQMCIINGLCEDIYYLQRIGSSTNFSPSGSFSVDSYSQSAQSASEAEQVKSLLRQPCLEAMRWFNKISWVPEVVYDGVTYDLQEMIDDQLSDLVVRDGTIFIESDSGAFIYRIKSIFVISDENTECSLIKTSNENNDLTTDGDIQFFTEFGEPVEKIPSVFTKLKVDESIIIKEII